MFAVFAAPTSRRLAVSLFRLFRLAGFSQCNRLPEPAVTTARIVISLRSSVEDSGVVDVAADVDVDGDGRE